MSKDPSSPSPLTTAIPSRAGFNLIELTTPSGLRIELLPSGAVFAVRHGSTQINQVLPGPAEDGLLRVFVRWQTSSGWLGAPVVSSLSAFAPIDRQTAAWRSSPLDGLEVTTTLRLCDDGSGWSWRIQVVNTALVARVIDVIVVQDLGLADEAAVRNSEAYTSQYIDLLPVRDATWGWTVLARQNRAMTGGRFPWLGLA
ncbi:MAG TPA: hypothetical protein VHF69_05330, partial [Candidatus Synoicihabitans sp.]|nr:hypothetical protein [Candidatus Synoicihabitans sp.]